MPAMVLLPMLAVRLGKSFSSLLSSLAAAFRFFSLSLSGRELFLLVFGVFFFLLSRCKSLEWLGKRYQIRAWRGAWERLAFFSFMKGFIPGVCFFFLRVSGRMDRGIDFFWGQAIINSVGL